MTYIILDGAYMESREALHDQLQDRLPLPPWYGRNLDALYDCLTDISEPLAILFRNYSAALNALGPYGEKVRRVLEDAAQENARLSFRLL